MNPSFVDTSKVIGNSILEHSRDNNWLKFKNSAVIKAVQKEIEDINLKARLSWPKRSKHSQTEVKTSQTDRDCFRWGLDVEWPIMRASALVQGIETSCSGGARCFVYIWEHPQHIFFGAPPVPTPEHPLLFLRNLFVFFKVQPPKPGLGE